MKLRELNIKTKEGEWVCSPKFAVVNQNNYRIIAVCCYIDDANCLVNRFNERFGSDHSFKVMEIVDGLFGIIGEG